LANIKKPRNKAKRGRRLLRANFRSHRRIHEVHESLWHTKLVARERAGIHPARGLLPVSRRGELKQCIGVAEVLPAGTDADTDPVLAAFPQASEDSPLFFLVGGHLVEKRFWVVANIRGSVKLEVKASRTPVSIGVWNAALDMQGGSLQDLVGQLW